jgi:DNA-binding NarL/FixJ family response regulator
MIRLVLVDDQELVRTGLRTLAEHDGDIQVVAEAADGQAGLGLVREHRPDIVLMDIRMPRLDGIAATERIAADPALDQVRVIVLTTFDEDDNVLAAIRAGAAGYLLKDVAPDDLRTAVRVVAAGDSLLSPAITTKVMGHLGARLTRHASAPRNARPAHRTRTRRARQDRPRRVERGDRHQPVHQPRDRTHLRQQTARQTRRPRPRPTRRPQLRVRTHHPWRRTGVRAAGHLIRRP